MELPLRASLAENRQKSGIVPFGAIPDFLHLLRGRLRKTAPWRDSVCRRYSEWHSEWHAEAALGRVGGINESDALPLAWLCGTVRAEVMQHEVLLQARRKGRSAGGF